MATSCLRDLDSGSMNKGHYLVVVMATSCQGDLDSGSMNRGHY